LLQTLPDGGAPAIELARDHWLYAVVTSTRPTSTQAVSVGTRRADIALRPMHGETSLTGNFRSAAVVSLEGVGAGSVERALLDPEDAGARRHDDGEEHEQHVPQLQSTDPGGHRSATLPLPTLLM
jgi:hypothetical protein